MLEDQTITTSPISNAETPATIETTIIGICARTLDLTSVMIDDDIYDLGSDSHQALLIALEIERVFDIELPLEVMEDTGSVREIVEWVTVATRHRAPR